MAVEGFGALGVVVPPMAHCAVRGADSEPWGGTEEQRHGGEGSSRQSIPAVQHTGKAGE